MDFKKILTDSGVSLFRKIVMMLRGILLVPVITKLMGVDTYGIWTLIFSLVAIFTGAGNLHLHGALIRYMPAERRHGQTVSDLVFISFFTALLTGGIVSLSMELLLSIPNESALGLSISTLAGVLVFLKIIGLVVKNIPRSEERVKAYELVTLAEKTLVSVALAVTLIVTQNIAYGLLSIVVSLALLYALLLVKYLPERVQKPRFGNFKQYLAYCSPMAVKSFSNKLFSQSDRFVILYFLSPTAVGVYSVAYGISAMLPGFTRIFNSTLYPSVTAAWEDEQYDDIKTFYENFLIGYVLLVIPALFGVSILASPILRLLATKQVAERGWILVPLVTTSFIFRGFENVLTYVLNAAEETEYVAIGTVMALLVNFVLNVVLLPVLGLPGAAIAMICGMATRLVYIYYRVRIHIHIPIPSLRIVKSLISSMLMTTILLYLTIRPDQAVYRIAFYPVVGAVVYFTTVYFVGGLTKSDINRLRSLL